MEGKEVRDSKKALERVVIDCAFFAFLRQLRSVVVVHLHTETTATLRHHLTDPAHPDNTDPFVRDLCANHEGRAPEVPFALAHEPIAFHCAPCGT